RELRPATEDAREHERRQRRLELHGERRRAVGGLQKHRSFAADHVRGDAPCHFDADLRREDLTGRFREPLRRRKRRKDLAGPPRVADRPARHGSERIPRIADDPAHPGILPVALGLAKACYPRRWSLLMRIPQAPLLLVAVAVMAMPVQAQDTSPPPAAGTSPP